MRNFKSGKFKIKWKQKRFCFYFHLMFWIFPLLIFLVQSEERWEFQNNFSFSVPYHIQPWYVHTYHYHIDATYQQSYLRNWHWKSFDKFHVVLRGGLKSTAARSSQSFSRYASSSHIESVTHKFRLLLPQNLMLSVSKSSSVLNTQI